MQPFPPLSGTHTAQLFTTLQTFPLGQKFGRQIGKHVPLLDDVDPEEEDVFLIQTTAFRRFESMLP